jgi:hypothetical protein
LQDVRGNVQCAQEEREIEKVASVLLFRTKYKRVRRPQEVRKRKTVSLSELLNSFVR